MIGAEKIARAVLLAALICGIGGVPAPARAQKQQQQQPPSGKPSSSKPSSSEPSTNNPTAPADAAPQRSSIDQGGFGAQLAHETREASGEETSEKTQFQESPSVQYVARLTGMSVPHAALASTLLNFLIVVAILVWAGVKFLPRIFQNRTAEIQKAMQEAQKASAEARRRLSEIESRLAKLDVEIGMMRDAAEREVAVEEERIRAAAEQDARKIVESAEQEITAAMKAAQRSLTAFAADLAVGLAQKQIHVDAATDQGLVRSFAAELGSATQQAGKDGR